MTLDALISAFLNYIKVEKGLAANTIAAYARDLRRFARLRRERKLHPTAVSPRRPDRVPGQLVSRSTSTAGPWRATWSRCGICFGLRWSEDVLTADPTAESGIAQGAKVAAYRICAWKK